MHVVLSVVDEGGYTAAAKALHVSQSSITRTVQEVEAALGAALFIRTTRRVSLTAEGAHFVTIARGVVQQFHTGLSHFRGYLEGRSGSVQLGTVSSVASTLLPEILLDFCQSHPEVKVSIQDGFSEETMDRVIRGTVDFAVTALHAAPDGVVVEPIATDRFVCIYRPDHHFAGIKKLSWTDLQGEPMIGFDKRSSIYLQINALLDRLGVVPHTLLQAREVNAIGGLVSAGMGVAIIPTLLLPTVQFVNLGYKVIENPVLERKICIVRDELHPLAHPAQALMSVLRNASVRGAALPPLVSWVDTSGSQSEFGIADTARRQPAI